MWNENNYKAFVGDKKMYDVMGALQFITLFKLGLREYHSLLDIGCGSLRAGRLFIPYLLQKKYYGIEPNAWLVAQGIKEELGKDIVDLKQPTFSYSNNFELGIYEKKFNYIIAHSIFSHATEAQIRKCIYEVGQVLRKDGKFIFTFCAGKSNNKKLKWEYPGKVIWKLQLIRNILKENGLIGTQIKINSPGGQTWIKAEWSKNVK